MKTNLMKKIGYIATLVLLVAFTGCFKKTENSQPTAVLAAISDTKVNVTVILDGKGSSDKESSVLVYKYKVEAENGGDITGELVDVEGDITKKNLVVATSGKYTVYLTVNDGKLDSKTITRVFNVTAEAKNPEEIGFTAVMQFNDVYTAEKILIKKDIDVEKGAKVIYNVDSLVPEAVMPYASVEYKLNSKVMENKELESLNKIILDTNNYDMIEISYSLVDDKGNYYEGKLPQVIVKDGRERVIEALKDKNISLDVSKSFDTNYSQEGIEYTWSIVTQPENSEASLMLEEGNSNTFTLNSSTSAAGIYQVRVSALKDGKSVQKDFEIKAKKAPTAVIKEVIFNETKFQVEMGEAGYTLVDAKKASKGMEVIIDGTISIPAIEDEKMIYEWSSLDGSVSLADETSKIGGFISDGSGTAKVKLTVKDIENPSISNNVIIEIVLGNNAPEAAVLLSGEGTKLTDEDSNVYKMILGEEVPMITLDAISSNDFDGDILEYKWSVIDGNITLDEVLSKQGLINGLELPKKAGTYKFKVIVSDNNTGTVSKEVTIEVLGEDVIVLDKINYTKEVIYSNDLKIILDASSAVAEMGVSTLGYTWKQIGTESESVTLDTTTPEAISVVIPEPGHYKFELIVADTREGSTVASVTKEAEILVRPGLEDKSSLKETYFVGKEINLKLEATTKSGNNLEYSWVVMKAPDASSITDGAINMNISTQAVTLDKVGEYEIKALVTDKDAEENGTGIASKWVTIITTAIAEEITAITSNLGENSVGVIDYDSNTSLDVTLDEEVIIDGTQDAVAYNWTVKKPGEKIADNTDITFTFNPVDYKITTTISAVYITGSLSTWGWSATAQELTKDGDKYEYVLEKQSYSDILGKEFKFVINGTDWTTPAFVGASNVFYTAPDNGILTGKTQSGTLTTASFTAEKAGIYSVELKALRGETDLGTIKKDISIVSAGKNLTSTNYVVDLVEYGGYFGNYTFENSVTPNSTPSISGTKIIFSESGYYEFELKDGDGNVVDTVTIGIQNNAPVVKAYTSTTTGAISLNNITTSAATIDEGDAVKLAIVYDTDNKNSINADNDNTYEPNKNDDEIINDHIVLKLIKSPVGNDKVNFGTFLETSVTTSKSIYYISVSGFDKKGEYTFEVRIDDGEEIGVDTIKVIVDKINVDAGTIIAEEMDRGHYLVGDTIKLMNTTAEYNDGAVLSWEYSLPGTTSAIALTGTTSSSLTITTAGAYKVNFKIVEEGTTTSAMTKTIVIDELTAFAKMNDTVGLGNELTLDASGSKGNITQYTWTIKKGTVTTPGALVKTVETSKEKIDWTPSSVGNYNVALSVTDGTTIATAGAIDVMVEIVRGIDFITAPIYKSVNVTGNFNLGSGTWNPAGTLNDMIYAGNGVWEKIATIPAGGSGSLVKFTANDGWDTNWGGSLDALVSGGSDIPFTIEAGKTYKFVIDTLNVKGSVVEESVATISVTGDFDLGSGSWNPAGELNDMTYVGNGVWEKIVTIPAGGSGSLVKFTGNDGWDINWGGSLEALVSGGSDIPFTIEAEAEYRFRIIPEELKAIITKF